MTLEENKSTILQEFESLETWEEKFEKILEFAKKIAPVLDEDIDDKNIVYGCSSTLYITVKKNLQNEVQISAFSTSKMVLGMIGLIAQMYNGYEVEEAFEDGTFSFLEKLDIFKNLTNNRALGLQSAVMKIKQGLKVLM